MKRRKLIEQETIINYNNAEKTANVSTFDKRLITKLKKLAAEKAEECELVSEEADAGYAEYNVPKRWIVIKAPVHREMTEEQKAALGERLKKARDNKES